MKIQEKIFQMSICCAHDPCDVKYIFFLRVALTGPRSVAISRLYPCSHWPLFAIAPTHEWKGNGATQTCTLAFVMLNITW